MIQRFAFILIFFSFAQVSFSQVYINDDFSAGLAGWTFANTCGGVYSGTTSGGTGQPAPCAFIQKSGCGAPGLPCAPELSKVVNFAPAASQFTLSYDYLATSNTSLSSVTSSRLKIINNDDGSTIINTCLVCGGTTNSGWNTYNGTFNICQGVSSITVILYSVDAWTATPWCRASYWDNVLLTATNTNVFSANSSSSNVTCNGFFDGTGSVVPLNGVAPFTYNWSSGGTGATELGLGAGTYYIDVTDNTGCTSTDSVIITEPTLLTTTITTSTNASCNGMADGGAISNTSGGTGGYTYNWTPAGGTTPTATGLNAGLYTITATDASGCTASDNVTITEPTLVLANITASTNVSCNGNADGSATVTASGGNPGYTYSWSSGGTGTTESNLGPGVHTVTVTDLVGCTGIDNVLITEPAVLSVVIDASTNVSCNGFNDGTASSTTNGGTAPYNYNWTPSGGTLPTTAGLGPGAYQLTVTDLNGCTALDNVTITEPLSLTGILSVNNNVSCNGGSDASIAVTASGGSPAYNYIWSSGGSNATESSLNAGTYSVTVTDSAGCSFQDSILVTEPTALSSLITASTNVSCNGVADGTASSTTTGGTPGYSYLWTPSGGTLSVATGLPAGSHTLTTTDNLGCVFVDLVVITEPPVLTNNINSTTDVSCFGGSDGSVTTTTAGGTGPYVYSWTPSGGAAASATGLIAGTYTLSVTDMNACTTSSTVIISEPAALGITFNAPVAVCFGDLATINTAITGGTMPYTYLWSDGSINNNTTTTILTDTVFTLLLTDANNCVLTNSVMIQMTDLQDASIPAIPAVCEDAGVVTLNALNSGGYWQGAGIIDSLLGLYDPSLVGPGFYQVTYTLTGMCGNSDSSMILVNPLPVVSTSPDITMGWGSETQIEVYGTGTYSWTPSSDLSCSDCPNPIADPLQTTTYCAQVVDPNGCSNTACVTVYIDIYIECGDVFVPNAFSPNGDGNNDLQCVFGKCITDMSFQIYDRWGERVFESNDKNLCWDGYFRNKLMSTGVYVYVLRATLITGEVVEKSGNISLVR